MINFNRIQKECFWDYKLSDDDIKRLSSSTIPKEQKFLFEKILLNSSAMFNDLKIFDTQQLKALI
ncbi:MAG: hypothetical protein JXQ76_00215, partial [Campylobacterales bacterium]|nr:hypothetical protein [Campylobacterales bacterium]